MRYSKTLRLNFPGLRETMDFNLDLHETVQEGRMIFEDKTIRVNCYVSEKEELIRLTSFSHANLEIAYLPIAEGDIIKVHMIPDKNYTI